MLLICKVNNRKEHRLAFFVFGIILDFCMMPGVNAESMLQVPRGTYRETCNKVKVQGYRLKASCLSLPQLKSTSVDLRGCQGEIINLDGRLACTGKNVHSELSNAFPDGSYRRSCANIILGKVMLKAWCRSSNGIWRDAAIAIDQCEKLGNNNGKLVCE